MKIIFFLGYWQIFSFLGQSIVYIPNRCNFDINIFNLLNYYYNLMFI